MRFAVPALILALLSPSVCADAGLSGGVVTVDYANQYGRACQGVLPAPDLFACMGKVDAEPTAPGHSAFLLDQRISYVGVATNTSLVGVSVLPDESVRLTPGGYFVDASQMRAVGEAANNASDRIGDDNASLHFSDERVSVGFFGPTTVDPTAKPAHHEFNFIFTPGHGPNYGRVYPFTTIDHEDSTRDEAAIATLPPRFHDPTLDWGNDELTRQESRNSPKLTFGMSYAEFQVATNPALLSRSDDLGGTVPESTAATATREGYPLPILGGQGSSQTLSPELPGGLPSHASADGPAPPFTDPPVSRAHVASKDPPARVGNNGVLAIAGTATAVAILFFIALYHRIRKDRVLQQETREKIYNVISAENGIGVAAIAERLGLSYNAVKHHIRHLEASGLIRPNHNKQRKYYLAGVSEDHKVATDALSRPGAAAIYAEVAKRGPMAQAALCKQLALAPFEVSRFASHLERARLIERERVGRTVIVRLAPAFSRA